MPITTIAIHYESMQKDDLLWSERHTVIDTLNHRHFKVVILSNQSMSQPIKRLFTSAVEVYGKEHYDQSMTWPQFVNTYAAKNQPHSILYIGTKEQAAELRAAYFVHAWDNLELNFAFFNRIALYADTFNYYEKRQANYKEFKGLRFFGRGFGIPREEKLIAAEKIMEYAKNPTTALRDGILTSRSIQQGKLHAVSRRYGFVA